MFTKKRENLRHLLYEKYRIKALLDNKLVKDNLSKVEALKKDLSVIEDKISTFYGIK